MKKKNLNRLAAVLSCVCVMLLAGCGAKEDAPKSGEAAEKEQAEQILEDDTNTDAETTEAPVLEGEGVPDSADAESVTEDPDEENAQKAQALYEAQVRHYYGGVLSQIIAARQFPDGELDTSSLDAGFGEMRDNHFAVTDIDGDSREELIVSYSNATMAGMQEIVYDYDPVLGQLKREFTSFPALTYYDNGVIKAEASHNHTQGEFWPFVLYRYVPESDSYEQIAYVCAWDKEISAEWYEGQAFPDALDADGDGTVYCIQTGTEIKNSSVYEDYKYDQADYEVWYEEIMEGAVEHSIEYLPMEYTSFAEFTPAYLKLLAGEAGKERTDTAADLGLMILQEDHFLDTAQTLLTEQYGIELEQPEPNFEEWTVGLKDGREVFAFEALNAGHINYKGEKLEDVTIFGIYPGISVDGAWEKLKAYGFTASPDGEVENCLTTGDGFGNVSIWFLEHDGFVTDITVGPYCAFAG